MPRIRKWTSEKIEKLIQEGYGQGEGKDYKPWIQIGDFSSKGRGSRILGHKTGRVHHFFSDLESNYYYNVIWSDSVIDVREQFPLLPLSETEEIAEVLGIAHPKVPGSGISIPMTTDFLITVRNQNGTHLEARFVKYSKDLTNPRVQEKLTIEKTYWERRGVPFKIVTEHSIHMEKVKSISGKSKETGKERHQIQRLLYRYWAGGMSIHALYPNRGMARDPAKLRDSEKMLGRRPTYEPDHERMNIGEKELTYIREAMKKYYNKHTKKSHSMFTVSVRKRCYL